MGAGRGGARAGARGETGTVERSSAAELPPGPAMGGEDYYLELCERPVQFEKANPVNCVFFDEANKQVSGALTPQRRLPRGADGLQRPECPVPCTGAEASVQVPGRCQRAS